MRARIAVIVAVVVLAGGFATGQSKARFNPMVELLSQKKPVFGLYAPSNRRFAGGGPGGAARGGAAPAAPAAPATPDKTPAQLAKEAVDNKASDFIFDGSMEGDFDRAYGPYSELIAGMGAAGILVKTPAP